MRQSLTAHHAKRDPDAHLVELRIPSSAEWVGVARLAMAGIASRLQFSIEDIEDLKLAVAEACTSYIQGAHERDEICMSAEVAADRITITVDAAGQNADLQRAGTAQSESGVGSLGLFLIRTLMDEVSNEPDPESGMKLVMTKFLRK